MEIISLTGDAMSCKPFAVSREEALADYRVPDRGRLYSLDLCAPTLAIGSHKDKMPWTPVRRSKV
jgi:hypothetical protein